MASTTASTTPTTFLHLPREVRDGTYSCILPEVLRVRALKVAKVSGEEAVLVEPLNYKHFADYSRLSLCSAQVAKEVRERLCDTVLVRIDCSATRKPCKVFEVAKTVLTRDIPNSTMNDFRRIQISNIFRWDFGGPVEGQTYEPCGELNRLTLNFHRNLITSPVPRVASVIWKTFELCRNHTFHPQIRGGAREEIEGVVDFRLKASVTAELAQDMKEFLWEMKKLTSFNVQLKTRKELDGTRWRHATRDDAVYEYRCPFLQKGAGYEGEEKTQLTVLRRAPQESEKAMLFGVEVPSSLVA